MIKTDPGQYSNKELVDVLNNYLSRIFNISQEYLPQPYAVDKHLEFVMPSTFFQLGSLNHALKFSVIDVSSAQQRSWLMVSPYTGLA